MMRWLTKLRISLGHDEPLDVTPSVERVQEAQEAKLRAEKALRDAKQRRVEINEVANSLKVLRARNHFGESIQIAMMRK